MLANTILTAAGVVIVVAISAVALKIAGARRGDEAQPGCVSRQWLNELRGNDIAD